MGRRNWEIVNLQKKTLLSLTDDEKAANIE